MFADYGRHSATSATELAKDVAEQTEDLILRQLSELVRRGLLVVKQGPGSLVQAKDGGVEYRQTVELQLKGQEYIEQLEKENKELQKRLFLVTQSMESVRQALKEASDAFQK